MKLSAWLHALAAIIGLTKAKPKQIENVEKAAAAVEAVEKIIEAENNQPTNK